MLRIVITSLLMVNAIFWGIYPPADDSPHSLIIKYLGLNYNPGKFSHLIIGTIFLIICYFRFCLCHFSSKRHLGFEMAIWYWHFVDVVWILVFISIYWWGNTQVVLF